MGAKLKKYLSAKFFKSLLFMSIYFAMSILVLHDVFIIVVHTIDPSIFEAATPYLLDKLITGVLATLAM